MSSLSSLSDSELVARLPALVGTERHAMADVIEHLVEVERRRLYLRHRVGSLCQYCIKHLGYDEDAAHKRHQVAKLAVRLPRVLDELRAGTMHLTGLLLLGKYLTEQNAEALLAESRGKSRHQIEEVVARWFPRPDVPASIEPLPGAAQQLQLRGALPMVAPVTTSRSGAGNSAVGTSGRLELLSPSRVRVEFSARAEVYDKLEKARELLSHAVPSGDLGELFERALDALLEQESRKRFGAQKPRKTRAPKPGSRHVPVLITRAVWERDGSQCSHVDADGQRCGERRFLTIEHRVPFALGGQPTLDNLCLLCWAHNMDNARQVFGEQHIEAKIRARKRGAVSNGAQSNEPATTLGLDAADKVRRALCQLGFRPSEASAAVGKALGSGPGLEVEQLLRACLLLLLPVAS